MIQRIANDREAKSPGKVGRELTPEQIDALARLLVSLPPRPQKTEKLKQPHTAEAAGHEPKLACLLGSG